MRDPCSIYHPRDIFQTRMLTEVTKESLAELLSEKAKAKSNVSKLYRIDTVLKALALCVRQIQKNCPSWQCSDKPEIKAQ